MNGGTDESYIDHTFLYLASRIHPGAGTGIHAWPGINNKWRGHVLHYCVIRDADRVWTEIQRERPYLRATDEDPEGMEHEVRATCPGYKLDERSHGYSDLHGHGSSGMDKECDRFDPGRIPETWGTA